MLRHSQGYSKLAGIGHKLAAKATQHKDDAKGLIGGSAGGETEASATEPHHGRHVEPMRMGFAMKEGMEGWMAVKAQALRKNGDCECGGARECVSGLRRDGRSSAEF